MNSQNIYQFKISLKEVEPKIWRRIQVPGNYSFWEFHLAIRNAMGWSDCQLHLFNIRNPITGQIDELGIKEDDRPEIKDYFINPNDEAEYIYDLGNKWKHEIILENITIVKYPRCIAGENANPLEDVGGPEEYQEILDILKNPQHPMYESSKKWQTHYSIKWVNLSSLTQRGLIQLRSNIEI